MSSAHSTKNNKNTPILHARFICILGLLVCTILISSCTTGSTKPVDTDYATGTNGILLAIKPISQQMRPNQEYPLPIEITNNGFITTSNVIITATTDTSVLRVKNPPVQIKEIQGKSVDYPKGQTISKILELEVLDLPSQSTTQSTTLTLTACYPYKTIQTSVVCIDASAPDVGKKICKPQTLSAKSGGAPLNIQKIDVVMIEYEQYIQPRFVFYINKPKGTFTSIDSYSYICSSQGTGQNEIRFNAFLGTGQESKAGELLECDTEFFTFESAQSNQVVISCKADQKYIQTTDAYQTVLTTVLEYGHIVTQSKELTIKR
jgi:hypothetical protein